MIKGFIFFDKIFYDNNICFIFRKRTTCYFCLRKLDITKINASASYKILKLLERQRSVLIDSIKRDQLSI